MWCFCIHALFKKFLKKYRKFYSKNDYIQLIRKIYINKKYQDGLGSFYIYCTIYDSLVFLYKRSCNSGIADKHLSACIKKKKLNLLDSFLLKIAKKEYEILIYIDNI